MVTDGRELSSKDHDRCVEEVKVVDSVVTDVSDRNVLCCKISTVLSQTKSDCYKYKPCMHISHAACQIMQDKTTVYE